MKKMQFGEVDPEEKARRGYGFVESFSKRIDGSQYSRINIVLDVVDAVAFDQGDVGARLPRNLSLVRIMTTINRLSELFDIDASISEGDWFHVTLAPRAGMPRAWVLEAEAGYGGQ